MPTATRGEATIDIAAEPGIVYDVLSDVTRMGERSPECYRCEWLDGATMPQVGARFRGFNRLGVIKWSTTCVVTKAERGEEFAFTVMSGRGREETKWRYVIRATETGCRVTESYEFRWCPVLARIAEIPFPRDKQLRRGLERTLAAIKESAEAAVVARRADAREPEALPAGGFEPVGP
jgi:hypothetical protein